jgi:hypothetical protein
VASSGTNVIVMVTVLRVMCEAAVAFQIQSSLHHARHKKQQEHKIPGLVQRQSV